MASSVSGNNNPNNLLINGNVSSPSSMVQRPIPTITASADGSGKVDETTINDIIKSISETVDRKIQMLKGDLNRDLDGINRKLEEANLSSILSRLEKAIDKDKLQEALKKAGTEWDRTLEEKQDEITEGCRDLVD